MIKKETIIKAFSEEDIKDAIKIYEKYKLAFEKNITIFTSDFCPPSIWGFFLKYCSNSFKIETNGLFEEAERRMISFNNYYNENFPIKTLEIINKSNFSNLKHKDYLGAILSLGIERNKLGDIIVEENKAYVPVINEIADYIINNLSYIGKSPINIREINNISEIPSFKFEEVVLTISSLRVDSIVAKLANISRSRAIDIIESGKVLIDYLKAKDKSQEIVEGTRITIRGLGKFIVGQVISETKSGKQRIIVKKYA